MIKKTGCQRDELGTLDLGESIDTALPRVHPLKQEASHSSSLGDPSGNELFLSLAVSGLCSPLGNGESDMWLPGGRSKHTFLH